VKTKPKIKGLNEKQGEKELKKGEKNNI